MNPDGAARRSGVMTNTNSNSFRASRGALAALRGCLLLSLCLGLTAAFLAEVWSGPSAAGAPTTSASSATPGAPGAARS
jgi:hypothetical protein